MKHIGREISIHEAVHHINGVKTDNRIENLHLMTRSEHMRHHAIEGKFHERLNAANRQRRALACVIRGIK